MNIIFRRNNLVQTSIKPKTMMRHFLLSVILLVTLNITVVASVRDLSIKILWKEGEVKGKIEVQNAELSRMFINEAEQKPSNKPLIKNMFHINKADRQFLVLYFSQAQIAPGPNPALITVSTGKHAFSFFLRDVTCVNPIYIPSYGVAVVPITDSRNYGQIERDILSRRLLTKAAKTNLESETSFEQIAPYTRNMSVPIWLGLGRDMRLFEISEEMQDMPNVTEKMIIPTNSGLAFTIPETGNNNLSYRYALGRGIGALNNIRRWLDSEALPIYHSEMRDDDIIYHSVSFATLEKETLTEDNVEGTDFLISDSYSRGRIFTPDQQRQLEEKQQATNSPTQEIVLFCRTQIVNNGRVPRYAWFKVPIPAGVSYEFDPATGFSGFSTGNVFCISLLDGRPVPAEEMAVLIQPGDTICLDFRLMHSPVDVKRAAAFREKSFDEQ